MRSVVLVDSHYHGESGATIAMGRQSVFNEITVVCQGIIHLLHDVFGNFTLLNYQYQGPKS